MRRVRWPAVALMALAVAIVVASLSPSVGFEDNTSLITNGDDDVWTVAAEDMPSDGVDGNFTHGILTLENATEEVVTLERVELTDVVGEIALVDSYIAPRGRKYLYVSSDAAFPPESAVLDLQQLAGFKIQPGAQGEGAERNEEVVLHLRVPGGQERAGYSGFCVEFSTPRKTGTRRTCNNHAFFVCRDIHSDRCGPLE